MKRTKILYLILSMIMVVFLISSCNSAEEIEYIALEIGSYDLNDGGNHTSEFDLWGTENLNYHQRNDVPREAVVTFNGVEYSGTYQRSAVFIPNLYVQHRYEGDNVYFFTNGDTGELKSITFVGDWEQNSTVEESYCRQIADSVVKNYIDLNQYKVDVEISEIYMNYTAIYTYYREINGLKTADSLTIAIDGNGNVRSFGMKMLGSFADIESVELYEDKATKSIESKLDTIYNDNKNRKGYEIEDVMLIKLPDGSTGFLYTIENQFETADKENEEYVIQSESLVNLILKPTAVKSKSK